jgi:hypothetical protein
MTKSEDRSGTDLRFHDELSPPSFSTHAVTSRNVDEIVNLRMDNVRLQRLVAELLVENQQLRQRYCGAKGAGPSAVPPHHDRRDH